MTLISGLVLEIGGQLSHGAIIAREYGIPAVINVPNALQAIRDGQAIILDGDSGRIALDEEETGGSGSPGASARLNPKHAACGYPTRARCVFREAGDKHTCSLRLLKYWRMCYVTR